MKRYVYILYLFCFLIILSWILYNYYPINTNKKNIYIKIDIPNTKYPKLNKKINKKITNYKKEFYYNIKKTNIPTNCINSLIITYDKYNSKNFLSYVFYIEYYTGGAHPTHNIWTINYDKINNKIITIENLIKHDNNILNKFSKLSRRKLIYNKKIVNSSMLYSGTNSKKDNFKLFILTTKSIILYFPEYQIAPYSSSSFSLELFYNELIT